MLLGGPAGGAAKRTEVCDGTGVLGFELVVHLGGDSPFGPEPAGGARERRPWTAEWTDA
jgi:hypothetical protein